MLLAWTTRLRMVRTRNVTDAIARTAGSGIDAARIAITRPNSKAPTTNPGAEAIASVRLKLAKDTPAALLANPTIIIHTAVIDPPTASATPSKSYACAVHQLPQTTSPAYMMVHK